MAKWWILTVFGTDLESGQNILKPLYHLIKVVSCEKKVVEKHIFNDTILKSGKNDQFAIAISREPINDGLLGGLILNIQNWTKNDSRTKKGVCLYKKWVKKLFRFEKITIS